MTKYQQLRQYLSQFISGTNFDAIMESVADQLQKQEDLAIAVTNQLTICTSSDVYLDKRLAELGITRPSEIGMDDLAFRKMGIQINQSKQVSEAIHTVLATMYGDDAVRAYVVSSIAGPYSFAAGDDLIFALESGETLTLTLIGDEFEDIQNATVEEICFVITRYIRSLGSDGYAQVYLDVDTGFKYVQIFGGAKGPYSIVQILGGVIQSKLEFPQMRDTFLPSNTTVWQITRNVGSIHRFRWDSGPAPMLNNVIPGDSVMIYGPQFESVGFIGTYTVTQVRPPQPHPSNPFGPLVAQPDSGYFEIEILGTTQLSSSQKDLPPPPNTINNTYSITVMQNSYDDLKFFLAKKSTPYMRQRYALAWEPADNLLRIYMPATTKVVKRELVGSAHLHMLYTSTEFNGTWGSASNDDLKVIVTSERGLKYKQNGLDCSGSGGTLTYGLNTLDIDYIYRENGYTHIFTVNPHGLTGVLDAYGQTLSSTIVTVVVTNVLQDDQVNKFLGPYIIDTDKNYTLTNQVATTREKILAGEKKSTLLVEGVLPNSTGNVLFGLNLDTEETPVKYLAAQSSANVTPTAISSISQNSTTVIVTTTGPHGLISGQDVQIVGTVNFNGSYVVDTVPASNIYTFTKTPPAVLYENTGFSQPIIDGVITTLILDSSYTFKNTHEIGTDVTLLSDTKVYEPAPDGTDYGFYVTGTAEGRIFAQDLMTQITALGINMEIHIIFPDDIGLGNQGESTVTGETPQSDATYVWGADNA